MQQRTGRIIIGKAGGTAGREAKTYKVSLPSSWIHEMGLTDADREIELRFDGEKIILARPEVFRSAATAHRVLRLHYYNGGELCSVITADYTDQVIQAEDFCTDPVKTAFGRRKSPTWQDYEAFLESRCIPRARAGLREYLEAIGVSEYDPLAIIRVTGGRMAEDDQWLTVEGSAWP